MQHKYSLKFPMRAFDGSLSGLFRYINLATKAMQIRILINEQNHREIGRIWKKIAYKVFKIVILF